jgi:MFS transporter, AAHS family, 4-hydroxybenzoate transporter
VKEVHRLTPAAVIIVGVVMLALLVDGLDLQLLALVAPVVISEWDVTRTAFGPAMSAALLGIAVGTSVGGWMGDRFGRKQILLWSVLWFGLATIAASFTQNVTELALLRLLGGLGFGAAGPNGVALANEWVPLNWRPRVTSMLTMGTPMGGMLGAAAVPTLLPLVGWRGSFVYCGVISLVLAVLVFFIVRESPAFKARAAAAPLPGDVAGLAGVFAPRFKWLNIGTWTCYFFLSVVAYAIAAWSPVFLTTAGLTLSQALRAVIVFNLCAVCAAISAGFIVTLIGSRLLIGVCCTVLLAAIAVLYVALLQSGPVVGDAGLLVMGAMGAIGATTGTTLAMMVAILALAYPTAIRSTGLGMGGMVGRTGGIAIALFGGAILSTRGTDPTPLFIVLGVSTAIAFAAMLTIDRHIPARGLRDSPLAATT